MAFRQGFEVNFSQLWVRKVGLPPLLVDQFRTPGTRNSGKENSFSSNQGDRKMFATQESTPWYRSLTGLIAASLLLPPLGLALLWIRRDAATKTKILATLCIVMWGAGCFYLLRAWRISSANDAHYEALERHRQQQMATAPTGSEQAVVPANPQAAAATQ